MKMIKLILVTLMLMFISTTMMSQTAFPDLSKCKEISRVMVKVNDSVSYIRQVYTTEFQDEPFAVITVKTTEKTDQIYHDWIKKCICMSGINGCMCSTEWTTYGPTCPSGCVGTCVLHCWYEENTNSLWWE